MFTKYELNVKVNRLLPLYIFENQKAPYCIQVFCGFYLLYTIICLLILYEYPLKKFFILDINCF